MAQPSNNSKTILVTGGAGFIGSNFVRHALRFRPTLRIVNLDALTYAGNLANFRDLPAHQNARHRFVRGAVQDKDLLEALFSEEAFDAVVHFAAESHVDRSILNPEAFVDTNIVGSFRLLEAARRQWERRAKREDFRFLHVSTDEVYGSLGREGHFAEDAPYDPSSPYSASKAASDHFVRAYFRTYGLPVLITNCSNNYGPYQFPEKLIPLMILNILEGKPLPVYGDGRNVRDWLYVLDHCEALFKVLDQGKPGETYNVGGGAERENLALVQSLCDLVDEKRGPSKETSSRRLIRFVTDRPGHDLRYAVDAGKIRRELGWTPKYEFAEALEATVDWYLKHMDWVELVRSGEYRQWIELNYGERSHEAS